ncbi:SGNH superfamily hydrolase [Weissella oryzae SG25]|uniref:SGNH superfamily hydrolase n=1 Tax=Weissella oryzae (strain DSM 25784 / JCM 18191 / LMG 30913 / SG25) TaxID=1329250 RepID=A0A069CRG5_WEIOS|nr:GDSL-type esterase/lipase family protein [Weissella oryzae]GAK30325.1 SGNH superfamily hydrolase [Weissella oryzae SG25]
MKRFNQIVVALLVLVAALGLLNCGQIVQAKTIHLVAVGDSLTEGVGDTTKQQGYTKRTAKLLEKQAKVKVTTANYGKAGDRSDQILKRIKSNPKAQKDLQQANVITLTVGGNDLQQVLFSAIFAKDSNSVTAIVDKSLPDYSTNLANLVSYLESQNKKAPIYLFGNYNPLYVYLANRVDLNDDVKRYNAVNAQLATDDSRVKYVSTFSTLTYGQYKTNSQRAMLAKEATQANQGSLNNKSVRDTLNGDDKEKNAYITNLDHYHPNDLGYDKMSKLLVKEMQKNKKAWLGE